VGWRGGLKGMANRSDLVQVAAEIRDKLDRTEIALGLDYQAQHLVQNLSQTGNQVHGFVRLDPWYEVKLDLADFASSRCTCPQHRLCSHTVAVFAEVHKPWGNTRDLLLNGRARGATGSSAPLPATPKLAQRMVDRATLARMVFVIGQRATWDAIWRGLSLESRGQVGECALASGFLTAQVNDEQLFRADLPLTSTDPHCACSEPQICAHAVAVFAAVYRPYGDPLLVLQAAADQARSHRDAVTATGPTDSTAPRPQGEVLSWLAYLAEAWQTNPIVAQPATLTPAHQVAEAERFYAKMIQYGKDWPNRADERQFVLTVSLFCLIKVTATIMNGSQSAVYYSDFRWRGLVETILAAIQTFCLEDEPWENGFFVQRAVDLEDLARDMLDSRYSSSDRPLWAYQMLWNGYFPIEHAEHEGECLRQLPGPTDPIRQLAWAHILSLTGDDDQARKILGAKIRAGDEGHLLAIAEGRIAVGELTRAAEWLHFVETQLASYSGYYGHMVDVWEVIGEAMPNEMEALERRLRADWPTSQPHYVAHFFRRDQPKEALGALMAGTYSPSEVSARTLDNLWGNYPTLMLAWYHQVCDQLVQMKRRDGYRDAALLLVSLRRQYRKTGRGQDWDLFLGAFGKRYGRLKALRDELKRKRITLP